MGMNAIRYTRTGAVTIPNTDAEWNDWVSAASTRNFLLDDPLLDWLQLYGKRSGFTSDGDLAGYDARTDFSTFIFQKAIDFEKAVLAHLASTAIVQITASPS